MNIFQSNARVKDFPRQKVYVFSCKYRIQWFDNKGKSNDYNILDVNDFPFKNDY
jgi:hypothetical protein